MYNSLIKGKDKTFLVNLISKKDRGSLLGSIRNGIHCLSFSNEDEKLLVTKFLIYKVHLLKLFKNILPIIFLYLYKPIFIEVSRFIKFKNNLERSFKEERGIRWGYMVMGLRKER